MVIGAVVGMPNQDYAEETARNVVIGSVEGAVVQARDIQGDVHVHQAGRVGVVPRQLPAALGAFAGRRAEFARLSAALDGAGGAVVISAIGGGWDR